MATLTTVAISLAVQILIEVRSYSLCLFMSPKAVHLQIWKKGMAHSDICCYSGGHLPNPDFLVFGI